MEESLSRDEGEPLIKLLASRRAVSRSCLCGLLEILELKSLEDVRVDIQVASPNPDRVDLEQVMDEVPIGRKSARAVEGGMTARGICVPQFAPQCDQIVVANAAVTVFINRRPGNPGLRKGGG